MVSIAALHRASSVADLATWADNFGGDVILLLDDDEIVYDAFRVDNGRPQYIVIDQNMTITYKGSMQDSMRLAEEAVLDLL